jgi:pyridoxal phosphate enzyme (YggS family)
MDRLQRLEENVKSIHQRCANAAQSVGRDATGVQLVAVTKYVDTEWTECVAEAGCHQLGENRPQQLWEKSAIWKGPDVAWHMIGHLQRNKVARTLSIAHLIHAGDSMRLLKEINRHATETSPARVLVEVNISGDSAKTGFSSEELPQALDEVAQLPHLIVCGLMAMASGDRRGDEARSDFSALRELRDLCLPNCPGNVKLDELSMGMSGDFEVAIEEGATIVRVGSAIFEGVV